MGCDTKGIVRGHIDPLKLFGLFTKNQVKIVSTYKAEDEDADVFVRFEFNDGKDERSLAVFRGDYADGYRNELSSDGFDMPEGDYTLFSFGCWGNSVELMEKFVKFYGGGWMIDNDCESEWREVVA